MEFRGVRQCTGWLTIQALSKVCVYGHEAGEWRQRRSKHLSILIVTRKCFRFSTTVVLFFITMNGSSINKHHKVDFVVDYTNYAVHLTPLVICLLYHLSILNYRQIRKAFSERNVLLINASGYLNSLNLDIKTMINNMNSN